MCLLRGVPLYLHTALLHKTITTLVLGPVQLIQLGSNAVIQLGSNAVIQLGSNAVHCTPLCNLTPSCLINCWKLTLLIYGKVKVTQSTCKQTHYIIDTEKYSKITLQHERHTPQSLPTTTTYLSIVTASRNQLTVR